MKPKTVIVLLAVVCVALIVGIVLRHKSAVRQKNNDDATIQYLSNQWDQTSARLTAKTEESATLAEKLKGKVAELDQTSAQLTQVRTNLALTQSEVRETKEQLDAAKSEIEKRDTRIGQLETQNLTLDKQANDMKAAIADLEGKISDTEQQLAKSEGDREFLLKELKRLQAEKAELERKFSDLVVLREQVRKLKEDLALSRRLEWIRLGLYGEPKKGAALLQGGMRKPAADAKQSPDLNVEIRRDGSSTILAPTNAPPGTGPR